MLQFKSKSTLRQSRGTHTTHETIRHAVSCSHKLWPVREIVIRTHCDSRWSSPACPSEASAGWCQKRNQKTWFSQCCPGYSRWARAWWYSKITASSTPMLGL